MEINLFVIDDRAGMCKRFAAQIANGAVGGRVLFHDVTGQRRLLGEHSVAGTAFQVSLGSIGVVDVVFFGLDVMDVENSFAAVLQLLLMGAQFFFGRVHFVAGEAHELGFAVAGSNVMREVSRVQKRFAAVFADESALLGTTDSTPILPLLLHFYAALFVFVFFLRMQ